MASPAKRSKCRYNFVAFTWRIVLFILENGDTKTKVSALKNLIYMILNGEKMPGLLMPVIRFLLPMQVSLTLHSL